MPPSPGQHIFLNHDGNNDDTPEMFIYIVTFCHSVWVFGDIKIGLDSHGSCSTLLLLALLNGLAGHDMLLGHSSDFNPHSRSAMPAVVLRRKILASHYQGLLWSSSR